MMRALLVALLCVPAAGVLSAEPAGQGEKAPGEPVVTIRLKDGSTLVGTVTEDDETTLKVVTAGGLELEVPRSSVESIKGGPPANGSSRSDPTYSRLLFAPTGRPLASGDGYFSDHYVFFPGFGYGITGKLSVGAGVSIVPGLGLGEQIFYVAPRFGTNVSDRLALSTGVLYARGGEGEDGFNLGLGFAVATFGRPDRSFTAGFGLARTVQQRYETLYDGRSFRTTRFDEVSNTPIVMLGGTARISRRVAFVSESWLIMRDGFRLSEQPFGFGLRFFGERISADFGLIFVGEVLKEGLPVPWLSFSYHFGRETQRR